VSCTESTAKPPFMNPEFLLLLGTAVTIGLVHTVLGPDHYVPFVAMSRARHWSHRKTLAITLLSGLGHVSSSVIIGAVGLVFGVEILKLTSFESARGAIAGWLLFGFGLAYAVWGIRHAVKHAPITHEHEGVPHTHFGPHQHRHDPARANITPWVLFAIFVFGPCEPLIPLVMYPAARADVWTTLAVIASFSLACIGTMLVLVHASLRGLAWVPQKRFERYSHALAGCAVMACGAGIVFLGL
jgi:nickel/cobalt transporter (NicO) family protein